MRRVGPLPLLASGALALGVGLAVRAPGYDPAFAYAFATALLWRLLLGRDGRRLLPRRALAGVLATVLAVGATLVLTRASEQLPATPLPLLLETLTALATVALLGRLDAFGAFWLVLLSSTHAAGACYVGRDLTGLLLVPLYVAWLAGTLVVLERAVAEERGSAPDARRQVLVDPASPGRGPLGAAVARLVAIGFAGGLLVWLLAPRPGPAEPGARPGEGRGGGSGSSAARGIPLEGAPSGTLAITGPDETSDGVVLGTVGRIQEDNRVHFEVRLTSGDPGPAILLREDALDTWEDEPGSPAPRWRSALSARQRRLAPGGEGWVTLPPPHRRDPVRSFECTLRLDRSRLFLEPDALRFRVRRPTGVDADGVATGPAVPLPISYVAKENGQLVAGSRLRRGDVVEFLGMPQARGGAELLGTTSDADVSPLPAYVAIDPALGEALLRLSRDVPGVQAPDPWRRAQALERWLQGPRFTYELKSPPLAPGASVLDFLTRVRKGNCEWFATSLTLLLRAHGMAARYVRGYWGGAHTPDTDLWTFYGTHYHAWSEIYLDGVGWVPLNPTPPERLAEGADPHTRESARRAESADGEVAALDADGEGLAARFRHWLGRTFAEGVLSPVARSFTTEGGCLGWAGGAALLGLAWAWRRRAAGGARGAGAVGARSVGPYEHALRILARRGLGRRREWTAREFLARAGGLLPAPGAAAFARLTALYEGQRFAGRPGAAGAGRADVEILERALAGKAERGSRFAP